MSTTRFKIPFVDHYGDMGTERQRWLYVNEHHTSGSVGLYDTNGDLIIAFHEDSELEDALVAALTHKGKFYDKREAWDGEIPKQRVRR